MSHCLEMAYIHTTEHNTKRERSTISIEQRTLNNRLAVFKHAVNWIRRQRTISNSMRTLYEQSHGNVGGTRFKRALSEQVTWSNNALSVLSAKCVINLCHCVLLIIRYVIRCAIAAFFFCCPKTCFFKC